MANVGKLAEAHTLKLWTIETRARNDIEEAYIRLTSKITAGRIAGFFAAIEMAGREVIGHRGQAAVDEGVRYSESLLGGKVQRATLADLADTVESYVAELGEHVRHVQALMEIRAARMAARGMDRKLIAAVFLNDFQNGGEHTKFLKNSIKRSVGSAVHQLGKEAEFAALRKKRERVA